MTALTDASLTAALNRAIIPEVKLISSVLNRAGYKCWVVGGSVRDIALRLLAIEENASSGDWDLATSAEPKDVQRLFRKVIPTGIQHGTVTVVMDKQHFEITTLRGERGHSDGRRPDEVFFVTDIEADLARRDFTVNAIAYDLDAQTLHDPFSGLSDLRARTLRAVGEAQARFGEDGLRVLRCARFAATLNFDIEPTTLAAIAPSRASFAKVAQERVAQEWFKALSSKHPSRFLETVDQQGLLEITAPELSFQGDPPSLLTRRVALARLDALQTGPLSALALVIIAATKRQSTEAAQNAAAEANARRIGQRLKLSRTQLDELLRLTRHHQLPVELMSDPSGPQLRRYLARLGRSHLAALLSVQKACLPDEADQDATLRYLRVAELLQCEAQSSAPLSLKELSINGQDLMELGAAKGPQLGQLLNTLFDMTLDEPSLNDRATLLAEAQLLIARA